MQTEQTRMVSTATVPARPNRPSLSILIAGIAAASMIFSTLGVVLYEASGHQFLTRTTAKPAAPVSSDTTAPAVATAAPAPREAGKPSGAPPSPLDLPVWAVVPIQNPILSHQSARQIENPLTDMLESIALTRTVRGKVVLFLSGNVRQGRPVIAEALSSLAVERGMLSFLAQLEVEHPEGVVSMQNRFVQTHANTVRATIRSLLLLFAGPSASDPSSKSDIRTEFDIIVVDGTAIRNPVELQGLASYIDYAVFLVNDTQQPVGVSETMRALAGNSSIVTGVVVDQAAA
jgi:hypothetical protein